MEQEAIIAAENAEKERIENEERVGKLIDRKGQMMTILDKGQKLIYKQSYSQELFPFNEIMHKE